MNFFLNTPWVKVYLLPVVDIVIIALVIYRIYVMISGTRAIQVVKGLALIIFAAWFSNYLHLETVSWLLKQLVQVAVIAIIILFQPELRRMLTQLGQNRLFGLFFREEINVVNVLVRSSVEMSRKKMGALIAVESTVGLKNYIETGVSVDGKVGIDILLAIFTRESPLHDGAVIVRRDRIVAAKCILPLTDRHEILAGHGTRHLAALGLAEETDAFIVVVSEETGKIAVARFGKIETDVSAGILREKLNLLYANKT